MTYQKIKAELYRAAMLVDDGDIEEADRLIRGLAGQGMTANDLHFHLGRERIAKLRRFAQRRNGN